MNTSTRESLSFGIFMIGASACAFALAAYMDYKTCESKSAKMAIPREWRPYHGCMIEPSPGVWILLDNFKMIGKPLV